MSIAARPLPPFIMCEGPGPELIVIPGGDPMSVWSPQSVNMSRVVGSVSQQRHQRYLRAVQNKDYSQESDLLSRYRGLARAAAKIEREGRLADAGETATGKPLAQSVASVLELQVAWRTWQGRTQLSDKHVRVFERYVLRDVRRRRVESQFRLPGEGRGSLDDLVGEVLRELVAIVYA